MLHVLFLKKTQGTNWLLATLQISFILFWRPLQEQIHHLGNWMNLVCASEHSKRVVCGSVCCPVPIKMLIFSTVPSCTCMELFIYVFLNQDFHAFEMQWRCLLVMSTDRVSRLLNSKVSHYNKENGHWVIISITVIEYSYCTFMIPNYQLK